MYYVGLRNFLHWRNGNILMARLKGGKVNLNYHVHSVFFSMKLCVIYVYLSITDEPICFKIYHVIVLLYTLTQISNWSTVIFFSVKIEEKSRSFRSNYFVDCVKIS